MKCRFWVRSKRDPIFKALRGGFVVLLAVEVYLHRSGVILAVLLQVIAVCLRFIKRGAVPCLAGGDGVLAYQLIAHIVVSLLQLSINHNAVLPRYMGGLAPKTEFP